MSAQATSTSNDTAIVRPHTCSGLFFVGLPTCTTSPQLADSPIVRQYRRSGGLAGVSSTRRALVALVLFAGAIAGCSEATHDPGSRNALRDDAITVGSFNFAESLLLAEVYAQTLEASGYMVRRATDLGPREFVAPAMASGLVELVPEYIGTAVQFHSLGAVTPGSDLSRARDALSRTLRPRNLAALAPSPAQDANAFVVTRATAERYGLRSVSDLAAAAHQLTFGGPPECSSRPLCLVGLRRLYGIEFKEIVELDAGGPLTRRALETRGVDVALMFTTAPALATDDLVELVDDRGLQPAENVVPVVNAGVIDRWGKKIVDRLDIVSARLSTESLRKLNAEVERGEDVRTVAARWLDSEGLR
jgi:osmoprotectant transport system substrate-binding protein